MFRPVIRKNTEYKTFAIELSIDNVMSIMTHAAITSEYLTSLTHDTWANNRGYCDRNYQVALSFKRHGDKDVCNICYGGSILIMTYAYYTKIGLYRGCEIIIMDAEEFYGTYDVEDLSAFTEIELKGVDHIVETILVSHDAINDILTHPAVKCNYSAKVKASNRNHRIPDYDEGEIDYDISVKLSHFGEKKNGTRIYGNQFLIIDYIRNTFTHEVLASDIHYTTRCMFDDLFEYVAISDGAAHPFEEALAVAEELLDTVESSTC